MLHPLFRIASLTEQLESGALVLTSNNRLANKIRDAWGQYQLSQGLSSWEQPQILAIDNWLEECWQEVCDRGIEGAATRGAVIAPHQERLLWEQAIANDREMPETLLPTTFTSQAQQAYQIVQQWLIPEPQLKTDSAMFARWIANFRQLLNQSGFMTVADRNMFIQLAFGDRLLEEIPSIILVGFQTLPPLHKAIVASASDTVSHWQQSACSDTRQQLALDDEACEISTAAAWAFEKQRQHPHSRIGIVVPELERLRGTVERVVRNQLEPHYSNPRAPRSANPFNISAGVALADTPLVDSALGLLSLNRAKLPLAEFCKLLNSSFWGAKDSLQTRALAEIKLREQGKPTPSCSDFRYLAYTAEQALDATASGISTPMESFESLRREATSKMSFSGWAEHFSRQLNALSWPGERGLDSIEFQQQQQWLHLLEQFSSLDLIGTGSTEVRFNEAFRQLQQLANNAVFQAETRDAAIQILGLLESAGLAFDYLWVMGVDDRNWPKSAQTNPLLPVHLQRQHQTPRATPERELELARQLIQTYGNSASEVVFSYSQFDGERELRPSQLIADLPRADITAILSDSGQQADRAVDSNLSATVPLETVDCQYGPALADTGEDVRGGSGIFADQASCPFNAFVRYRLGAMAPAEPCLGLSALERGSILHSCLEYVWQQLENQQALLAMVDAEIDDLLDSVIEKVLQPWKKSRPDLFGPKFTRIEQLRLKGLLHKWLALEKQRPPFTVAEFESWHRTEFEGIALNLRIDRADRLEDGRLIIIDYKTGKSSIASWLGVRPEQPQMPLYALCIDDPLAAVTFATINAEQQQFIGIGQSPTLLPNLKAPGDRGTPESWEALIQQWQVNLRVLAEEYKAGFAAVASHNKKAMQWQTELLPLNRFAELDDAEANGSDAP